MRILIFYQYYHNPDCAATGRHYTFVRHWAQRHEVTLVTTRTWLDRRLTHAFDWAPPGVRVHLLDVPYDNAMRAPQRALAFARYAAGAVLCGLRLPRPDVILGVSTPLTAAWAADCVARCRRVPWIFEVQDLWPDFPVQMGALPWPWLQRPLYALEAALYRRAAHVVTLSPDMSDHVRGRGLPAECVTTLLNGTDLGLLRHPHAEDEGALRTRWGLGDRRIILYAGTYGRANDIPTLLEAAGRLAGRADLAFVFIGQGYFEPLLRASAGRQPNIVLVPPVPRHQIFQWFAMATLSLVPFIDLPVLSANSPAKFFDSLAAGTPVVVTNPGWMQRFVEDHRCGWYVPASDAGALAACVERLLADPAALAAAGLRGADAARRRFDREAMARRLEALMEQIAAR